MRNILEYEVLELEFCVGFMPTCPSLWILISKAVLVRIPMQLRNSEFVGIGSSFAMLGKTATEIISSLIGRLKCSLRE